MKTTVFLLVAASSVFADVFKQKIKVGRLTCTCSFSLIAAGTRLSPRSKAGCDKKCSGVAKRVSLEGDSGVFTFDMKVAKGKVSLSKGSVKVATTTEMTTQTTEATGTTEDGSTPAGTENNTEATEPGPTGTGSRSEPEPTGTGSETGSEQGTGSGSGEEPVPIGPGSGSGEEPVPIGTGSGTGPGPVPTGTGSGPGQKDGMQCSCKCDCPDGSGQCDCDCNCPMQSMALVCAPGFTRVCPMMEEGCPPETEKVCPKGMEEEPVREQSRMGGGSSGCQCVPDFLMSLMKEAKVAVEPVDRAVAPDVFKNLKLKMGKIKCTCTLTLLAAGPRLSPKSKAACDKKCSGTAKKVVLTGKSGNVYTLDIVAKKGKAKLKGTVKLGAVVTTPKPTPPPGTPKPPGSGSGNPPGSGNLPGSGNPPGPGGVGGQAMGPSCSCVATKMGGGGTPTGPGSEAGSGSEPGPTGTGSGSGPEPTPMPGNETTGSGSDDEVVTRVKSYIDTNTCNGITYSEYSDTLCGDNAVSYYKEFTYNNKRVIVSNNIPDHPAESDQLTTNPNVRCPGWQFIQLPIDPAKGSSATSTGLGTIGLAITGGAFFNDLSNPDGSLALPNEGPSLDSCLGHSAPAVRPGGGGPRPPPPGRRYKRQGTPTAGRYHYHANLNCTNAGAATGANDPDQCLLIGYYQDGVPVYGFCKDNNGMMMTSCYKTSAALTTVVTVSGTYESASTNSDYTYTPDAGCNLDEASGAVHPTTGKYSYFMTTGYPWTPIKFFGDQGSAASFCSA